jgi:hypothetical protein
MNTTTVMQKGPEVHVPPTMGSTVDEVLRAFVRDSDEWCGLFVYEALLLFSRAGPARKYRVQGVASSKGRSRIGVAECDGLCLRDCKPGEEDELEEGLALGFVQITRQRRGLQAEIVHQSTARPIPMK